MSIEETLFNSFESYPFDEDPNFKDGLAAVLAQGSSGADSELLIGRAKAYYFSSVSGKTINWDEYAAYKSGALDSNSTPAHSIVDNAQSPRGDKDPSDPGSGALSFAQITALIESGQTPMILTLAIRIYMYAFDPSACEDCRPCSCVGLRHGALSATPRTVQMHYNDYTSGTHQRRFGFEPERIER